jgi:hypothetical protein
MAAGGLAAAGRLSLPGAVGLSVLATLVTDLAWYATGRVGGGRVLSVLCRVSLEPDSCVRQTLRPRPQDCRVASRADAPYTHRGRRISSRIPRGETPGDFLGIGGLEDQGYRLSEVWKFQRDLSTTGRDILAII